MKANLYRPLRSWRGLVAVLLLGTVASCLNQKKVTRWNNEHPKEAAEYAADHFPCVGRDTTIITSTDSAGYKASLGELWNLLAEEREINDSLSNVMSSGLDTSCQHYRPLIYAQAHRIKILENQAKNIKPVIQWQTREITTIDSSKAQATRLRNWELEAQVNNLNKNLLKIKGTSRTRLWMLISCSLLNGILLFLVFKTKKFKLPWKLF